MKKALMILALMLLIISVPAYSQEHGSVGLVISKGDGEIVTECIPLDEPRISGFDALSRSSFAVTTDVVGLGTTVCSIDGAGCPADDCFCQCKGGGDCIYWSYWHLKDDGWHYSNAGSALYQLEHGAVDGWVWDVGTPNDAPAPPVIPFEQICGGAASEPLHPPAPTETGAQTDQAEQPLPSEAEPTAVPESESNPTAERQIPAQLAPLLLFILFIAAAAVLGRRSQRKQSDA